jgi:hypothetical protein
VSERRDGQQEQDAVQGVGRVDSALGIYLGDSSLWPVLFAALTAFVTLGTWLVWMVAAGRNPFGALALLLLLGMSVDLWIRDLRQRRFGATSRVVLAWWALCIAGTGVLLAGS